MIEENYPQATSLSENIAPSEMELLPLSVEARALLPTFARMKLVDELLDNGTGYQGGINPARLKIESIWSETTGSHNRKRMSADILAMEVKIVASGGPEAFLKEEMIKNQARSKKTGSTILDRLFGKR